WRGGGGGGGAGGAGARPRPGGGGGGGEGEVYGGGCAWTPSPCPSPAISAFTRVFDALCGGGDAVAPTLAARTNATVCCVIARPPGSSRRFERSLRARTGLSHCVGAGSGSHARRRCAQAPG